MRFVQYQTVSDVPFPPFTPTVAPSFEQRFTPPLSPAQQRFDSDQLSDPTKLLPPLGAIAWPVRAEPIAKPVAAAEQKFFSDHIVNPTLLVNSAAPSGYLTVVDYRFAGPYPVGAQRFDADQQAGAIVNAALPAGYQTVLSYNFGKPFPLTEQMFTAFGEHIPEPIDVTGFYSIQLDYKFRQPFPAAEQQAVFEVVLHQFPDGWRGYQLDYRFGKPFAIHEQRWDAFEPQGSAVNIVLSGWQTRIDIAFGKQFPTQVQQWDAWPAQIVLPVFPPGAGKRYKPPTAYLPQPAWDTEPNPEVTRKPVQPIWDRKPEPQKKPEAPPVWPTLGPPQSLFAPPPQPAPPRIVRPTQLRPELAQLGAHYAKVIEESAAERAIDERDRQDAEAAIAALLNQTKH